MQVKAKVAHLQPGTNAYRFEGEQFEHEGKIYKHVEPVKGKPAKQEDEEHDEQPAPQK